MAFDDRSILQRIVALNPLAECAAARLQAMQRRREGTYKNRCLGRRERGKVEREVRERGHALKRHALHPPGDAPARAARRAVAPQREVRELREEVRTRRRAHERVPPQLVAGEHRAAARPRGERARAPAADGVVQEVQRVSVQPDAPRAREQRVEHAVVVVRARGLLHERRIAARGPDSAHVRGVVEPQARARGGEVPLERERAYEEIERVLRAEDDGVEEVRHGDLPHAVRDLGEGARGRVDGRGGATAGVDTGERSQADDLESQLQRKVRKWKIHPGGRTARSQLGVDLWRARC